MRRPLTSLARTMIGVGVLAFLVARMGLAPFVDAIGALRAPTVVLALAIFALSTILCAWRWRVVASGLGIPVPMPLAVAAYYQSQFLDATLPGGVLGDLDRGVRHGRHVGAVGRGLRVVVWERSLGQGVQLWLTVLVVLLVPFPARAILPTGVASLVAGMVTVAIAVGALLLLGRTRAEAPKERAVSMLGNDLRKIVGAAPGSLARIVLASSGAVAGHVAMFVIAARASGVSGPLVGLLPVALVVMVASGLPVNIAGWGPREGAAAWAFGAAGLGAAQGVTTAVVYGVMGLVASLPGAIVMVGGRRLHRSSRSRGAAVSSGAADA
jgi:glycosyltransferase 2 family protein